MRREKYSHRERLQMILAGEKPDRHAASFWRHFFHREHFAEGTAEAMLYFQKEFDWDFMKINPRADYHVEGWGLLQEWSHDEFKKHVKSNFPVSRPEDWFKIKSLPISTPALVEHLKVVSLIRRKSDPELPILMTAFTPLAVAGRMVERQETLVEHIRKSPELVETALRAITDTFKGFVSELRNAGADGLFFATTQWASGDMITWEEYQKFGVPYDLEVIKATESDALNLLHVCSSNNYLRELTQLEYNAALVNWEANDPTNLPLDKANDILSPKVMVGGVDHNGWLQQSEPEEIRYKIDELKERFEPTRLIIGPGCSIPPETPVANLRAIRERL
ncbi:MAG: uroporphyrinogen decarboxylase family protein [Candidatus Zixiibacteriota bacterium]